MRKKNFLINKLKDETTKVALLLRLLCLHYMQLQELRNRPPTNVILHTVNGERKFIEQYVDHTHAPHASMADRPTDRPPVNCN